MSRDWDDAEYTDTSDEEARRDCHVTILKLVFL